jgi:hypothetical protein
MWPFLVVVYTPNPQFFGGVGKGHELVLVQEFRAEAAVAADHHLPLAAGV